MSAECQPEKESVYDETMTVESTNCLLCSNTVKVGVRFTDEEIGEETGDRHRGIDVDVWCTSNTCSWESTLSASTFL